MMVGKFYTIDDFDVEGKTVLLRIDINSPVDPNTGSILDDTRMKLHSKTILELARKGARVIILAHQSRPGKKDFTTLRQHSDVLSRLLRRKVKYVDSIFSTPAKLAINNLRPGEILLLENVRFFSEESLKRPIEQQAQSMIVRELSPLIDYFVNDAFAAAHRGQVSLVGFTLNTPSAAGRVMEHELHIIQSTLDNVKSPCVFALGGMKADDSIMVAENVCENGTADYVLTSGLVANIFLAAAGYNIGKPNMDLIKSQGYLDMIDKCKGLLEKYPNQIVYPKDVAVEIGNERVDVSIDEIPDYPIYDIGKNTSAEYAKSIMHAETIFANGPAGVFENPLFSIGTEDIINAIVSSNGYSIIGGGHIGAATVNMGYENKVNHVSSGGGACINLLAGKKLDAVEALINNKKRFDKKLNL
ncbi:phosphoglycerate kinase [Methanobrevibacter sp. 87.7]|uniref:phosphoglycerate kinase n=1 Tax=Methanobrevibacter sp. 87.7 TaxID=387957 RepID=UPI000B4FF660|nr:phosphoglycerate kinase [Methanobrevibacter sp. 87.7]OWT33873.1 phosphoglycerate kinase [Methanobrevibacter sp. 87.7]